MASFVRGRLGLQSEEFLTGIEVVAIDASAPFAAVLADWNLLPNATLVVEHWHLHRPANLMVTQVRQRATRQLARPPQPREPKTCATYGRPLLQRAFPVRPAVDWAEATFATEDLTGEILAAWAGKQTGMPAPAPRCGRRRRPTYEISAKLDQFYTCAADASVPELTRLAETIETWWREIRNFLRLRVTSARREGYNRTIKTVERVGRGYRNESNYRMRIMLHSAATAA